jgi:hypothetical protein
MKRTVGLLAAVLSLSLTGCAGLAVGPFRRTPAPTLDELIAPLRQRAQPVKTLYVSSYVSARKRGLPGRLHFQAAIYGEVPSRLRLRGYRAETLIFQLLADERGIRLEKRMDRQYFFGSYDRIAKTLPILAGLSPGLLFKGLLFEQAVLDELAVARTVGVDRHWRSLELAIQTDRARVRAFFDRDGRQIRQLRYEPLSGERATRIDILETTTVQGLRLPRVVEILHGPSRTRLQIEVGEYRVNPPLDAKVFTLESPTGQWLPIEQAGLGEWF